MASNSEPSSLLKREFLSFSNKCLLSTKLLYEDEVDEELMVSILRKATTKILHLMDHKDKHFCVAKIPVEFEDVHRSLLEEKATTDQDLKAVRAKLTQVLPSLRKERASRVQAEQLAKDAVLTISACQTHIDKLVLCLEAEASNKRLMAEDSLSSRRALLASQTALQALHKAVSAKDKYIEQLNKCNGQLEAQLRLMDEKFLDLRAQLRLARSHQLQVVDQAVSEASELRWKHWQEAHKQLDQVKLTNQGIRTGDKGVDVGGGGGGGDGTPGSHESQPGHIPSPITDRRLARSVSRIQHQRRPASSSGQRREGVATGTGTGGSGHRPTTSLGVASTTASSPDKLHWTNFEGVVMFNGSDLEDDKAKLHRALVKLRRMRGESSVASWTEEKARILAHNQGCFG